MFRRVIIATAASIALVVATGGAALAYVCPPDEPPPLCGVVDEVSHQEYRYQKITETDWVTTSPGDAWVKFDERTVTDKDAEDVTVQEAQHYSLLGWSGTGKDETPLPPSQADYWQANTHQEPHGSDNITWLGATGVGLHYASNGSSGNRDWFFFAPAVIEHHDAETHQEFRFRLTETTDWVLTSPGEGWVQIDERKVITTEGNPGYPCDDEPRLVVPEILVPVDECGTDDDHYTVPENTDDVTYWDENGDIIAALNDPEGTAWSVVNGSGWTFDDDNTIRFHFVPAGERGSVFTDVPCVPVLTPTGIPFSVTPNGPTCDSGETFDAESLGGEFNEETQRWEFENVNAEVIFGEGDVTINVFAHDGYVIDPSLLDDDRWFVEEGGGRASITITLDPTVSETDGDGLPCLLVEPIEVAPQIVQIDACGVVNDGWDVAEDGLTGIVYTQEGSIITATAEDGYVLVASNGWVGGDGVTATFDLEAVWTWNDTPCPTTTPPPVTPVSHVVPPANPVHTSTATLASTGSNALIPGLAAGILALVGVALTLIRKRALR